MKILISCNERSIEIETDRATHSTEERKALFDRMYADAINYIQNGVKPKQEGGAK